MGEETCNGFTRIACNLKSLDIIICYDIWSLLFELLATGIPTESCQGSIQVSHMIRFDRARFIPEMAAGACA